MNGCSSTGNPVNFKLKDKCRLNARFCVVFPNVVSSHEKDYTKSYQRYQLNYMHLVYSQVKTVLSNSSSYKTTLSDFIFIFFVENIFFTAVVLEINTDRIFLLLQLILLAKMDLSPAPDFLRTLSTILSYLDCGLNPLIYFSHQDFREAGLTLLWNKRKPMSAVPVLTAITKYKL